MFCPTVIYRSDEIASIGQVTQIISDIGSESKIAILFGLTAA